MVSWLLGHPLLGMNVSRQPQGVPSGGQFAASSHAETSVSLVVPREVGGPVMIPAGRYVIGDPCYSVPDDRWIEWLEAADFTEVDRGVLYAEIDGYPIVGISTLHGDGEYHSSEGHSLGVDAGLIGLVPEEFAVNNIGGQPSVVEFSVPVLCRYEENGVIHLGHIEINTGDDGDGDDDDGDDGGCRECGELVDGGGWDGLCGNCADKVSCSDCGDEIGDQGSDGMCEQCALRVTCVGCGEETDPAVDSSEQWCAACEAESA